MINLQDFSKAIDMKKRYSFILFLALSSLSFGQNAKQKKADKLFAKKAFVEAAAAYEALEPNKELLQNLADSYYYNSQMEKANKVYDELYEKNKDSLNPEVLFRYSHALKANKNYESADKILSIYLNRTVNTKAFIENLNDIVPYNYDVSKINSKSSADNFGMSYFGDKVVFASVRNTEDPKYQWNNKPYLDLYEATVSDSSDLEDVKPFPEIINTDSHESNATFSSDGKTMYFSRTNDKRIKINDQKIATVKIYKAQLVDTTWTNVEVLPFSSDFFSTQHPVLNSDNSRLYFASDMPESMGSFDIYYVDIMNTTYGEPINLGPNINTKHREQFPYIAKNGALYFSSDGHEGIGGLDIFRSKFKDNQHEVSQNLGETINSPMDDFSYVLDEDTNTGFLSSNRTRTDQLYTFVRTKNIRSYIVEGSVKDKTTKELLPNATVTLYNEDGSIAGQMTVNEDAKYKFAVTANTKYIIEGLKQFYIPNSQNLETNEEGRLEFDIELEIESYDDAEEIIVTKEDGLIYIELENIYFDLDKWTIKPDAARRLDVLVDLLKKYPKMEVELGAHTDSRSSDDYNLRLSDNRAKAALDYMVANNIDIKRLTSKGYGESRPLVNCGNNCSEDEYAINRRVEFIIVR